MHGVLGLEATCLRVSGLPPTLRRGTGLHRLIQRQAISSPSNFHQPHGTGGFSGSKPPAIPLPPAICGLRGCCRRSLPPAAGSGPLGPGPSPNPQSWPVFLQENHTKRPLRLSVVRLTRSNDQGWCRAKRSHCCWPGLWFRGESGTTWL